jgi:glycosyltransferase involved in cell wall biosynthesis
MPALVSIAIPIYNTARFLPAALDSLLAQDYTHWEGLLWDDGSTDGSARDRRRLRAPRSALSACSAMAATTGVARLAAGAVAGTRRVPRRARQRRHAGAGRAVRRCWPSCRPTRAGHGVFAVRGDRRGRPRWPRPTLPARRIPRTDLLVDFITYHFRLIRAEAYRTVGGVRRQHRRVGYDYDLCLRLSERVDRPPAEAAVPLPHAQAARFPMPVACARCAASFDAAQRALQRRGLAGRPRAGAGRACTPCVAAEGCFIATR